MPRKVHLCQSVEGALANWGRMEWQSIAVENNMTVAECKAWFRIQKFKGKKVIPIGEKCEGFSYETGCPGHEVEDG